MSTKTIVFVATIERPEASSIIAIFWPGPQDYMTTRCLIYAFFSSTIDSPLFEALKYRNNVKKILPNDKSTIGLFIASMRSMSESMGISESTRWVKDSLAQMDRIKNRCMPENMKESGLDEDLTFAKNREQFPG